MPGLSESLSTVTARAILLGERIDLKGLEAGQRLATNPLVISVARDQFAVLFRYGAVVLFGVSPLQEVTFLSQLLPLVGQPHAERETEDARLRIDASAEALVTGGEIVLPQATLERLQVVADVLAKSVVLGYYEASLAKVFDAVEPFALGLRHGGRLDSGGRDLLRYIGETLLIQHKMVGRVEVGEKPDVLWEMPELNRLFARLEDEYELQERRLAIERKLALISGTVETLVDLLQNKRALRVEWYIVALIVIEIFLTLYQLFVLGRH
jgi:uncharacterized Rmd1/YagE family protein